MRGTELDQLGENIKKLRRSLGKNQQEFAAELGYRQSTISEIENGHITVTLPFLQLLEKTYGVSFSAILKQVGAEDAKPESTFEYELFTLIRQHIQVIKADEQLSSQAFARCCQMTPERLKQLEQGKARPTVTEIVQILLAFPAYNANWLLMGAGPIKDKRLNRLKEQDELLLHWMEGISKKSGKLAGNKN